MTYILQKSIHILIIFSLIFAPIQYVSGDLIEQCSMQGMIDHSMDMTAMDHNNEHNCEHCDENKCTCDSNHCNCVSVHINILTSISNTFLVSSKNTSIYTLPNPALFIGQVSAPLFRPPIS